MPVAEIPFAPADVQIPVREDKSLNECVLQSQPFGNTGLPQSALSEQQCA